MNEPFRGRNGAITPEDPKASDIQFNTVSDQVKRERFHAVQSEVINNKVMEPNDSDEEHKFEGQFRFPEYLYTPPVDFPKQNSNITLWNWILRKFM